MMRRLYLLRHAKSRWDDPNLEDHDRPLAPRGERAGAAMAGAVAALMPPPALVLCSTARRAHDTLALVRAALPATVPVTIDPSLYTFDPLALRQRLTLLDDTVTAVLIVGHNPALERLAIGLARDDGSAPLQALRRKYPTAALASLDLSLPHWADLGERGAHGRLSAFIRPADLTPPAPDPSPR